MHMSVELTVKSAFLQHNAFYLVFGRLNFEYVYLYCYNLDDGQITLLFGENFPARVEELRQQDPNCCIECHLPLELEGGITCMGGKLEEFGITAKEANQILSLLPNQIDAEFRKYINLFPIEG